MDLNRRQWRKLYIGIYTEIIQIRAVQLTANNVSDSQVVVDLLAQIPLDEQIDSAYTYGTYDTKRCRQVIADPMHMPDLSNPLSYWMKKPRS